MPAQQRRIGKPRTPRGTSSKAVRQQDSKDHIVPNKQQQLIVEHGEGPLRVVAGPGTGKTATIVKRIVHLVADEGVPPSQIMVVTYTVKAARELKSRIAGEFAIRGIPVNLDQMRVGTFHALCLEILRDYAKGASKKRYSVIGSFAEKYRIVNTWKDFKGLAAAKVLKDRKGKALSGYRLADAFASAYSTALEEHASFSAMEASKDKGLATLAGYLEKYHERFGASGALSFADIQARTIELLDSNPAALADLQSKIRYIIVDEYQDANNIQEELVRKLAGETCNVCVVGDDDQSLYRFRGANVEIILRADATYGPSCRTLKLGRNYRSQQGIVDFCNTWMGKIACKDAQGKQVRWGQARIAKTLEPNPDADPSRANPVSVVSCTADGKDDWCQQMVRLVRRLQESPDFVDFNQIAFVCSSVRAPIIRELIRVFRGEGIPVYAPRAGLFFECEEVQLAVGCILKCLSVCHYKTSTFKSKNWWENYSCYADCIAFADEQLAAYPQLAKWVARKQKSFKDATVTNAENALLLLFVEMLKFDPFRSWVDADGSIALSDTMRARNLALFASTIRHFEAVRESGKNGRSRDRLDFLAKVFFEDYFFVLKDDPDMSEAEDAEDYAPKGYVSFLTTHQAKGLEFPVVVACSLFEEPREYFKTYSDVIRDGAAGRKSLKEQEQLRPVYDFWRQYYTAFSRAQDLLVLTSMTSIDGADFFQKDKGTVADPSPCFKKLYDSLPDVGTLDVGRLHLHQITPSYTKRVYSFTGNIVPFMRCPRAYRLHKELGFPSVGNQSLLFGTLVHRSIEDIHRRLLEQGGYTPSDRDISYAVSTARAELEAEGGTLLKSDMDNARKQVRNYLDGNKRIWRNVLEAEYGLSMLQQAPSSPRGGYILKGQIDLVVGKGNEVEILDFKTGQAYRDEQLPVSYTQQMAVYVHLLRQRGVQVRRASLYFTGAGNSKQAMQSCDVSPKHVGEVMSQVDKVVAKIEEGDFTGAAASKKICTQCLFKDWCGR